MSALNDIQRAHLSRITAADLAWREAKLHAHERARQAANEEITNRLRDRDLAVLAGDAAGLPRIELRRKHQGLHTTHANAVLESLARAEAVAA